MSQKNHEKKFLIFAGTTEGRELAEFLDRVEMPALVCVATEYGREVLEPMEHIRVRVGRMDRDGMAELIRAERPLAVVDATHPFADSATDNIRSACEREGVVRYRLLRGESDLIAMRGLQLFEDAASAASWLDARQGKILLTTGRKELPVFAEAIRDRNRLCVRTLLSDTVIADIEKYGLSKKQVICMQGPFSGEMNAATLRMTGAKFLVTKESGEAGGFTEKAEAAGECGATCVVIRRPARERGYSLQEVRELLTDRWIECGGFAASEGWRKDGGIEADGCAACGGDADAIPGKGGLNPNIRVISRGIDGLVFSGDGSRDSGGENAPGDGSKAPRAGRKVTILGIGMGAARNMTVEAASACREADCIIGAERMLDTLRSFDRPMEAFSRSDEIVTCIDAHPEYENIVVACSGDIGFHSGAKKLFGILRENKGEHMDIRLLCGISSVEYFAARLGIPWEDMALVSSHGREENLVGAVRKNEKVFTLASDAASIRRIAEQLAGFGFGAAKLCVGANLSYPSEAVYEGRAEDFVSFDEAGMFVALICNEDASGEVVSCGISDGAFVRGDVPMTKKEVRIVSISGLRLTRDAIVYDVGAGTGSVSVECARIADRGKVYAIEQREDACRLIEENRKKFAASNLEIIPFRAPECLADLPAPTHAFIGGSGGELKNILSSVLAKNPRVRIVVNAVTPETVSEALAAAKDFRLSVEDITDLTVAKAKPAGSHHMMEGKNPVYVIVFSGQCSAGSEE